MKDLLVLTADADTAAVMRAVLKRPQSLRVHPISFDVERHFEKDAGVVHTGPDLVRNRKGEFRKVILIWDYHGSGWDKRYSPEESMRRVQERLDGVTWKGDSGAIVLVPEEEWLWHDPASLCKQLGKDAKLLNQWIEEYARKQNKSASVIRSESPKELLRYVWVEKAGKSLSPRDFEEIATTASLQDWQRSASFSAVLRLLQQWFPSTSPTEGSAHE